MDHILITDAVADDARGMVAVHYAAVHQTASTHYPREVLDQWSPPLSDARIQNVVASIEAEDTIVVVARQRERVIGFGIVDIKKRYLEAVYVDPSAGRQGVGGRLLATLEARAVECGIGVLHLDASLNAVRFYQRHGYWMIEEGYHTLQSGFRMACVKMRKVMGVT